MLRNEYRMPLHGRLSAIIFRKCRSHPGIDKLPGMITNGIKALLGDIFPIGLSDAKPRPEFRFFQRIERLEYISVHSTRRQQGLGKHLSYHIPHFESRTADDAAFGIPVLHSRYPDHADFLIFLF